MIPESSLSQHIAILGKPGSGKTAAAKQIIEDLIEDGRHVCVVDPGGDWWGLRASADGKSAGLPVAVLGGPQADVDVSPTSGAQVAEFVANEPVPCVVDVSEWFKADQIRFMKGFVESLYRLKRQKPTPLHLVLEEADQFAPQRPMGEGAKLLNRMSTLVRLGRKRGFRIIMISQRPAILHKDVLTQVNTLIAMRLVGKQDKDAIEGWIKDNADPDQLKLIRGALAGMKPGEGWIYAPEEDQLERYQFPMFKTFDAGATPDYGDELVMPEVLADIDFEALGARFSPSDEGEIINTALPAGSVSVMESPEYLNLQATLTSCLEEEAAFDELRRQLWDQNQKLLSECTRLIDSLQEAGRIITDTLMQVLPLPEVEELPKPHTKVFHPTASPSRPESPVKESAANGEAAELSKGARTLLEAFVALYPRAVTTKTAATFANQSIRSSQFRPNAKALVDGGWIESVGGDRWKALPAARSLIGAPPVANTLETWCSRFAPSIGRMLRVIVEETPRGGLSKAAVAAHADVSPTSSSLGSGLRELKLNGLIEEHNGEYVASEVFQWVS